MLTDGDIVGITLTQKSSNQTVLNVFYYLIEVVLAGIELVDLLVEFRDLVGIAIGGVQSTVVTHETLFAENLTNGVDTEEIPGGNSGIDATGGPVLPSYVAAGIRLAVATKTTRPGGKRIAGIGEDRVEGNNWNPGGGSLNPLLAALPATLTLTGAIIGSGFASPIVVGRTVTGALDLNRTEAIVAAIKLSTIRTQVSRRASIIS